MSIVRPVIFVSFAIVGLTVAACGKPSKDGQAGSTSVTSAPIPKGGSCNVEKQGICEEYADSALGLAEGACKSLMKGSYAKAACSTQNLMGVCETKDEKKFYYFGNSLAPWVSDAKDDCEKNAITPGKFTAQPNAEEQSKTKAMPSSDKISAHCTEESGQCEDIIVDMLDMEKSSCESGGGKYATGACPTAGLVGSCVKRGKVVRYYTPALKSQKMTDLQTFCDSNGILFGHFYADPNAPAAPTGKPAAKPAAKAKAKAKAAP
jgi:hypothetical protein